MTSADADEDCVRSGRVPVDRPSMVGVVQSRSHWPQQGERVSYDQGCAHPVSERAAIHELGDEVVHAVLLARTTWTRGVCGGCFSKLGGVW